MKISFCEEARLYLLVEAPSGIVYEAQTGGIACNHPRLEGAIVAVASDPQGLVARTMCETGCWDSRRGSVGSRSHGADPAWNDAERARIAEALASVQFDGFTAVRALALDPAREAESEEGWWHVTFELEEEYDTWSPARGVLCGPNCD